MVDSIELAPEPDQIRRRMAVGRPNENVLRGKAQRLTRLLLDGGRRAVAGPDGVKHDQHHTRAAGLQSERTRVDLIMNPSGGPSPEAEQGTRDPVAPQAHPREGARVPGRADRCGLDHREADGEVRGRRHCSSSQTSPRPMVTATSGCKCARTLISSSFSVELCSVTRGVCLSATPLSRAKRDDRGWVRSTYAGRTARCVTGEKRTSTHSSPIAESSAAEHIAFP